MTTAFSRIGYKSKWQSTKLAAVNHYKFIGRLKTNNGVRTLIGLVGKPHDEIVVGFNVIFNLLVPTYHLIELPNVTCDYLSCII